MDYDDDYKIHIEYIDNGMTSTYSFTHLNNPRDGYNDNKLNAWEAIVKLAREIILQDIRKSQK